MFRRNLTDSLRKALSERPVVFLKGARQVGKSTLAKVLAEELGAAYVTMDNLDMLAAAEADAAQFIRGLDTPVVIDEVQRVPDLLVAIKASVDEDRSPGRFLLTGSADVLVLPKISETLVGRVRIVSLWPLSQGELVGDMECFIDRCFAFSEQPNWPDKPSTSEPYATRIVRGGYPELQALSEDSRVDWFEDYVTTILYREVRNLSNVSGLAELPRLLRTLALRSMGLLNLADVSRTLGMPHTTLQRYLALLRAAFLIDLLPAWSTQRVKRLVRSPKLVPTDTGLSAYLQGLDERQVDTDPLQWGRLIENLAIMELRKQLGWSRVRPELFHFRTHKGVEVDIVMEDRRGRIVGIEVKAGHTIRRSDLKGLHQLAEICGDQFVCGVVLHTGPARVSVGPRLWALPLETLWAC